MRNAFRSQQINEREKESKEPENGTDPHDHQHEPWPALHMQSAKGKQSVPQKA